MSWCTEDIEQIIVAEYLRQCTQIPFLHIANQRITSPQHGSMLKRMGVKAGVSDLFFPRGNEQHKGLWLELKTLTGKPSPEQKRFIAEMLSEGYDAKIGYGSKHAIEIIKQFYEI